MSDTICQNCLKNAKVELSNNLCERCWDMACDKNDCCDEGEQLELFSFNNETGD